MFTSEAVSFLPAPSHPSIPLLSIATAVLLNALDTAKMDTNYDVKTADKVPSYPHEKIYPAPRQDGETNIEAGDKEMNIGEADLGLKSNNSSTEVYIVGEEEGPKRRSFNIYWKIGHLVIWLVMTGYASPLLPSLLYLKHTNFSQLVDCRTLPSPI
jgi:hypothetical protein